MATEKLLIAWQLPLRLVFILLLLCSCVPVRYSKPSTELLVRGDGGLVDNLPAYRDDHAPRV